MPCRMQSLLNKRIHPARKFPGRPHKCPRSYGVIIYPGSEFRRGGSLWHRTSSRPQAAEPMANVCLPKLRPRHERTTADHPSGKRLHMGPSEGKIRWTSPSRTHRDHSQVESTMPVESAQRNHQSDLPESI
jgi:hypothetical protein